MAKVTYMDTMQWGKQAQKEARDWHKDANNIPSARLDDFGAGFDQGWREAIACLKLHGAVKLHYLDKNDGQKKEYPHRADYIV